MRLGPRTIVLILFALVTLDLLPFGSQFVKTHQFTTSPEKAAVLSHLSRTPVQGRVVTIDPQFKTNDGLRYGFPSVLGYDPLILKRYADYVLSSQGYPPNQHVVDLHGIHDPGARLLKFLNVRQAVVAGQVLAVENELPYAYLVHHVLPIPMEQVIDTMKSGQVDLRKTVILEDPAAEDLGTDKGEARAVCQVLAHTGERVTLKTSSESAGYLVVSEIFYPGWTAEVDGRKRDVMRGNYLFSVIPLEKGEHDVTLYFVSWPFRVGSVISLVTLVGTICALWLLRKRRGNAQV
jgi:hypothetical protein